MKPPIPDAARRLIAAHIPTVPHLEALVLARGDPARAWTARELGDQLYVPAETASNVLVDLVAAGFLRMLPTQPPAAHYAPDAERVHAAVAELVELYARRVVDVTRLIHAHDGDNAQRLADAFRLGRKT